MTKLTSKSKVAMYIELFLSTKSQGTAYKYRQVLNRSGHSYVDILKHLKTLDSNTYYNNNLSIFKSLYNFFQDNNLITVNPVKSMKYKPLDSKSHPPLDRVTVNRVLKSHGQLSHYVKLGLYTGLRSQELLSIKDAPIFGNYIVVTTKGSKKRKIELDKNVRPLIKAIKKTPLTCTPRWFRNLLERYCNDIGVETFNWHRLRSTFACYTYKKDPRIEVIAEYLGHSNLDTTKRYLDAILTHKIQKMPSGLYD